MSVGSTGVSGPDPELDELFDDPELRRLAHLLAQVSAPRDRPDPAFRSSLRRELMREAWALKEPRLPWWRRLLGPTGVSWAAATVGIALLAVVALNFYGGSQPGDRRVVLVQSPLANVQAARLQEPIPLTFSQPMDHASVEASIRIAPATNVSYQWTGNTLYVQPQGGTLAPNTRYQVQVEPTAQTSAGKPVAAARTISFVTAPAPIPLPSPTPSQPPAPQLGAPRVLAAEKGTAVTTWSPGATAVYAGAPDGVRALGVDGSAPALLDSSPADRLAVSPDGSQVLFSGSAGTALVAAAGGAPAVKLSPSPSLALGWKGKVPLYVQGTAVYGATSSLPAGVLPGGVRGPLTQTTLGNLDGPATEAAFSPDGKQLLYSTGGTVHLRQLSAVPIQNPGAAQSPGSAAPAPAQDVTWPHPGSGFWWSPDGSRVAYLASTGVAASAPDGTSPVQLATVTGPGGNGQVLSTTGGSGDVALAWSGPDRVLIATGAGLWQTGAAGAVDKLAGGAFGALAGAPDGSGVSFASATSISIAAITDPASPSRAAGSAVVGAFMQARLAGNASLASTYLDAAARAAYGPALAAGGEPHPTRDFVLLAQRQAGSLRYVVRVVLSQGKAEVTQYDETLTLVAGSGGKPVIDNVHDSAGWPVRGGPNVVSALVYRTRIQLKFDSDLDASTLPGSISVLGPDGKPVPAKVSYAAGIVMVEVPTLAAGADYMVVVAPGLTDVDGHAAGSGYQLGLVGPTALAPLTAPGSSQPPAQASPSPTSPPASPAAPSPTPS